MRLVAFIVFILTIACTRKETTKSNALSLSPIPLSRFSIGVPFEDRSEGQAIANSGDIPCDSLVHSERYTKNNTGVIISDSIKLWRNPLKEDVIKGIRLNFLDTVTVLSRYYDNCVHNAYYMIRVDNTTAYASESDIKVTYSYRKFLPDIYFNASEQLVWEADTMAASRMIRHIATAYAADTIIKLSEGELENARLTGHAAALVLRQWICGRLGTTEKELELAIKIGLDDSFNELKTGSIHRVAEIIDNRLSNEKLSRDGVRKNYLMLKRFSRQNENAAQTLFKYASILKEVAGRDELIQNLLSSDNLFIKLIGVKMQGVLAIQDDEYEAAIDVLAKAWQEYPDTVAAFYDYSVRSSLVPAAIVIDSLIKKSRDYKTTIAFVTGLQARLRPADSVLFNFLQDKKYQLCIESDCTPQGQKLKNAYSEGLGTFTGFVYAVTSLEQRYAIRHLLKNRVVVTGNVPLYNGVYGKEIKRFPNKLNGDVLYEYVFDLHNEVQRKLKVETSEGIFWVSERDIQRVHDRPLFVPSSRNGVIDDPIITEVVPIGLGEEFVIMDVNRDSTPDIIKTTMYPFAIDGKSTKMFWQKEVGFLTVIGEDMYLPDGYRGSLVKLSVDNKLVWKLRGTLPQEYGGLGKPVRYMGRAYAFAGNGNLIEIDDGNGAWVNTYQLPGSMLATPSLSDGQLYVIRDFPHDTLDTLYSIDLERHELKALYAFDGRSTNKLIVSEGKIHFKVGQGITSMDNDGTILNRFQSDNAIDDFFLNDDHIYIQKGRIIEAYDLNTGKYLWSANIPFAYNNGIKIKDRIMYICGKSELILISAADGRTLRQVNLPSAVYGGNIEFFARKLLISGSNDLIILENSK